MDVHKHSNTFKWTLKCYRLTPVQLCQIDLNRCEDVFPHTDAHICKTETTTTTPDRQTGLEAAGSLMRLRDVASWLDGVAYTTVLKCKHGSLSYKTCLFFLNLFFFSSEKKQTKKVFKCSYLLHDLRGESVKEGLRTKTTLWLLNRWMEMLNSRYRLAAHILRGYGLPPSPLLLQASWLFPGNRGASSKNKEQGTLLVMLEAILVRTRPPREQGPTQGPRTLA